MKIISGFIKVLLMSCMLFFLTLWYLGTFDGVDKPSVLTLFSKHEEGQVAKSMLNFDKKQGFREKHSETENRRM